MKKLLTLLFVSTILFTACDERIAPVDDTKEVTTVTLLEAEKDTVPILIDGYKIYVFNDEGTVEFEIKQFDSGLTFAAGMIFMLFIGGLVTLIILTNDL